MTSFADLFVRIADIRDRQALEVVSQLVKNELVVLQTQVTQLEQLNQAVAERLQRMDRPG
jgi:hypothetical protein